MGWRWLAVVLVAAGCQGYRPDSFSTMTGPFVGEARTVGCLDVAVASSDDPQADGPVARVTLGNRCDAGVVVDFGALRGSAVLLDGSTMHLRPFDPNGEIRPATLDARAVARETIEFALPPEMPADVVEWCVDIGGLDAGTARAQQLVCFPVGVQA